MKKYVLCLVSLIFLFPGFVFSAEPALDKKRKSVPSPQQYTVELTVSGIPKDQQTLFIPIKVDSNILDFESVGLDGLSAKNILAVASTSMDMVGTGVGLLKLDESGLPEQLNLKVVLKSISEGQSEISLLSVADEPALLSKGAVINRDIMVALLPLKDNASEIVVSEKVGNAKKKLSLSQSKVTLSIQRPVQKEESIFIPLLFDKNVIDLDETFGHAVLGPGITAKSFGSGTLEEGGPGVEIVLTDQAEKDFVVDVDLHSRKLGATKISAALPQSGHTAVIAGPKVEINPSKITVVNNPIVLGK